MYLRLEGFLAQRGPRDVPLFGTTGKKQNPQDSKRPDRPIDCHALAPSLPTCGDVIPVSTLYAGCGRGEGGREGEADMCLGVGHLDS